MTMMPDTSKRTAVIARVSALPARTVPSPPARAYTSAVGATLSALLRAGRMTRANFPQVFAPSDLAGPSHKPSQANLSGNWRKPARMGFGIVVLTFGIFGGVGLSGQH